MGQAHPGAYKAPGPTLNCDRDCIERYCLCLARAAVLNPLLQVTKRIEQLPWRLRIFLAVPFMHSESLADQEVSGAGRVAALECIPARRSAGVMASLPALPSCAGGSARV